MKNLYLTSVGIIFLCILIWLQAEPDLLNNSTLMQWRSPLIQITGIISTLLLTLVMILALRLPQIERLTAGLDKSYRLHKWLGIYAVVFGAIHWLLAIVPKQLVRYGVMERGAKPNLTIDPDSFYATIHSLRGGAESLGEWTLYLFIALILIALFAPIKYQRFKFIHKLMAITFLFIAYHSLVLLKHAYWDDIITPIVIGTVVIGVFSALFSLFGLIGKRQQYQGTVTSIQYDEQNKTTLIDIDAPKWPGHTSGQFAFLTLAGEEPHPFTITAAGGSKGNTQRNRTSVQFLVKALGDFTSTIHQRLEIGKKVTVEGPYGHFNFNDNKPQIWVAGGIGCAAFKARLAELKQLDRPEPILFYYCTENPSPQLIRDLESATYGTNVEFHVVDNRLHDFLTIGDIKRHNGDILHSSVWFCGPTTFSTAIQQQLRDEHFDMQHFHTELFDFR
ncbi:ferric reductase-like transmembrane domain-containing protein [Photobacterium sp. DA100]|uniref:ferredoxin reductase family protein n=1 Tax=Photobacterium sp. DA100 TaxID=3027472 RepID=UPI00247A1D10|nr:ferric reductase-like transmembrane domain-containing protein [Photobacterium sp. DA100]WEM41305.1 ferric reductase-like transmembrane domain-containing protein [Photobacterium sp. DA100]